MRERRPTLAGKIAVEEHFTPHALADTIYPSIGWDPTEWENVFGRLGEAAELRVSEMDAAGIEMSILSLSAPGIQEEMDVEMAIERASIANQALAEVVEGRPDRFAALAALPMQDPTAAAAELERAVEHLGFRGALVNGFSNLGDLETVAYYDEPQYDEFWERAAALSAPLYLHPRNPVPNQRMYRGREELLGPTWAFTIETATHALRLITSGLFDRYPSLTIVLGHMGELLPFAMARTQQRLSRVSDFRLERTPLECLRANFYITTSGNCHTPSLLAAVAEMGAERVLFAVDYPYEDVAEAATWFDGAPIDEGTRSLIARENAIRLFRLSVVDGTAGQPAGAVT
jgi:2,3-dihydroxybenzoate decarboxylase